ncbi:MAG: alpha/beta hydrolase [Myxococcota bacterium]|jgi:pimeloyl-ACP methyl ester carboxylesterase|nr:alpha/beta hydrolase [Myxococcota bacterium]
MTTDTEQFRALGFSEQRLSARRLSFALQTRDEQQTKILALHGWLDNCASFLPLIPLFRDRASLVVPDLAGHGLSEHRASGSYNVFDDAADVIALADALGWKRFRIVGHSMGANIAVLVAGAWPARVERVALLDGYGPFSASVAETPARLAAGAAQLERMRDRPASEFESLEEAVQRYRQHRTGLSEDSARLLLGRGAMEVEQGRLRLRHDPGRHAATLFRPTEEQVLAFLSAISCPVYAVRARSGWPVEEELLQRRVRAIKDCRFVELDGYHHVHMDHPERLQEMVDWLLAP